MHTSDSSLLLLLKCVVLGEIACWSNQVAITQYSLRICEPDKLICHIVSFPNNFILCNSLYITTLSIVKLLITSNFTILGSIAIFSHHSFAPTVLIFPKATYIIHNFISILLFLLIENVLSEITFLYREISVGWQMWQPYKFLQCVVLKTMLVVPMASE